MKLITATIRPAQVEPVKDALAAAGIKGMTIVEVQGFGNQGGHTETYRGTDYKVNFSKKVQIQLIVKDDQENMVLETICGVAKTGNIGDGKIWVSDVNRVIKVRTGEEGDSAL